MLFSSKYSCPICEYALPELEPRRFSFNSPVGAGSGCDGLGVSQFFDPARVVVHPELSLAAGAVRGWDRRNAYYFQLIPPLPRPSASAAPPPRTHLPQHPPPPPPSATATPPPPPRHPPPPAAPPHPHPTPPPPAPPPPPPPPAPHPPP